VAAPAAEHREHALDPIVVFPKGGGIAVPDRRPAAAQAKHAGDHGVPGLVHGDFEP
jgi:hypothetical protein